MAEKNLQRKLVQIAYDTDEVKGSTISVQTEGDVEILNEKNDGLVQVTFPGDYTGETTLTIKGSKSGEDSAEFTVD